MRQMPDYRYPLEDAVALAQPSDETPADRLRTAANHIRDNFTREVLIDESGRTCAVGAILCLTEPSENVFMAMLVEDPTAWAAVEAVADHLGGRRGCAVSTVMTWNDARAHDGAEVAAAMEKAAARWEEQHG